MNILMSMIKRGYTLIEVALALVLVSTLILGAFSLEAAKIKLRAENKKKEGYILYMQALKVTMMSSLTYDELKELYDKGNIYINNEDIDIMKLKSYNISPLFKQDVYDENLYIDFVLSGESPAKVSLRCHIAKPYLNEDMICEFYKGNY